MMIRTHEPLEPDTEEHFTPADRARLVRRLVYLDAFRLVNMIVPCLEDPEVGAINNTHSLFDFVDGV
ncbi:hypothetical protein NHX12_021293 [Muraenolepis orangiensis]|uniref:Uncharacterized protein n=1 Tax=Muraenolepis orangiensis TaxID=630683 RepID=A0A9Q0IS70_9TELE|nr:hypothetical protein NHX12_021293 [Muraenolepis orangiensis]